MILVDSSVWIDILKKDSPVKIPIELYYQFLICPPVMQEVLQGVKRSIDYAKFEKTFLAFTMVANPLAAKTYLHAAGLFRSMRRAGYTIRSSVDCLIAAIAIEEGFPICHNDRDYDHLTKISDLKTLSLKDLTIG